MKPATPHPHQASRVPAHRRELPLRVGTRGSPLALVQTRAFLTMLTTFCPVLRGMNVFEEHAINTTGDRIQDRRLAEIGGKGLFAKEIHEALLDRRVEVAKEWVWFGVGQGVDAHPHLFARFDARAPTGM